MSRQGFIVSFKNTASSETIKRQADLVNQNGGSVKKTIDSVVFKVRTACSCINCAPSVIMCNQGFTAEIPRAYLFQLQSGLKQGDSQIEYIGEAGAI